MDNNNIFGVLFHNSHLFPKTINQEFYYYPLFRKCFTKGQKSPQSIGKVGKILFKS